jgi:hypothetical protein
MNARSGGTVRTDAPWIALGSADHLEHPQTPWRREKNIMVDWKSKGKKDKRIKVKSVDLIVLIPHSVVALYIYRVGRSYPSRKSFYK